MKNVQEVIDELENLRNHSLSRTAVYEALDETISKLKDIKPRLISGWTPVENGLPDDNVDVQVTVQELEPGGETYRDVDCIINDGDGPVWAAHHTAVEQVLAWAPMLPVYRPEDGGKENSKNDGKQ